MRAGFGRVEITPRIGVELCGFGPFLCRHSIGIRDRLWARAMALEEEGRTVLIVSCDLVGITGELTARVREKIWARAGLSDDAVLICCTHTHSGPNTGPYIGWGAPDEPYLETLPNRIARAGLDALAALRPARLFFGRAPCRGFALNREYDRDAPPLEECLRAGWEAARPELTDTECQALVVRDERGGLMGFASYYGCHPVVCCAQTRFIHGDWPGVATNTIERDYPEGQATGLFLQGAQGDVNSCVVHKPETESLLALDVIAGRYARAVRQAIAAAQPVESHPLTAVRERVVFSRKPWEEGYVARLLAETEARLQGVEVTDATATAEWNARMETVYAIALRRILARMRRGESLEPETELHGIRIGPIALLGSPFETFQAIKNEVCAAVGIPHPLVLSFVNDSVGYAPDRTVAARGGYAQDKVPLITGQLPYARAHEELVEGLVRIARRLAG